MMNLTKSGIHFLTRFFCALAILAMVASVGCTGSAKQNAEKSADQEPETASAQNQGSTAAEQAEVDPLSALPEELQAKVLQPWNGDLDGMVKRRLIRALVVYNKLTYFVDNGTQRGVAYDSMKEFETILNKKLKMGKLGLHVVFIPVSRDQLLPSLAAGKGDIALGALTITPERLKTVDFSDPVYKNSSEIVVTGPGAPKIASVQDLSGQEVFVREGGSKYQSLLKLNEEFKKAGKKEIQFEFAPGNFEDDDILEMANAGLVKIVVVDKIIGEVWVKVFDGITLHPDVTLRTAANIGWAIRKNTPQFKAELNEFVDSHKAGTLFGNMMLGKYLKSVKYVKPSTSGAELKKYSELKDIFEKYGDKYAVDWILMEAQGYQESRLDQTVKSKVGAIGVMQVMPATGAELKVGDINQVDSNIHAGVKYMRFMIDQYYKDEPIDTLNKMLFTFASYNAGPNRLQKLRKEAEKRGLNSNLWFNNVEYVVSEKVGAETVNYVSNIYKYYVAYKLVRDQTLQRNQAKEQFSKY